MGERCINIIGINGSPRESGNSETLLRIGLKHISLRENCKIEQINLHEHDIKRCLACDVCGKTKDSEEYIPCVLEKKDAAVKIWNKIVNADGVLFATPVYFGLPSPLLIDFLNRSRYLRHQDFKLTNTVFGVIATAGRRSGGNETTILSTWYPLIRNGMIPVGNGDKSCQFGAVGWAGGKGEIWADSWAITQTKDLANRVYDLARVITAGANALSWKNSLKFDYPSASIKEWYDLHNLNLKDEISKAKLQNLESPLTQ